MALRRRRGRCGRQLRQGGAPSGVLFAPGNNPFVITVGAIDIGGTSKLNDDDRAPWSAYGRTPDGFMKPEICAPGRNLVGPIPAGSTLAIEKATSSGRGYVELSGTSFAAPVIAGIAAQILARNPGWRRTGQERTHASSPGGTGGREVLLRRRPGERRVIRAGHQEDVESECSAEQVRQAGRRRARRCSTRSAGRTRQDRRSWDAVSWTDVSWSDVSWDAVSWSDVSWTDVSWRDVSWSDVSWEDAGGGRGYI